MKQVSSGMIGSVLCLANPSVLVMLDSGYRMTWQLEDCKPVPEKPRNFKVGDKVVYEYEDGRLEYTIIQAIRKLGDDYTIFTPGDTYAKVGETMRYRHATPEEVFKYFN